MKRLCSLIVLLIVAVSVSAENRIEVTSQNWAKAWSADGVSIKSGFEPDGTQNLVVLARGGYLPLKVTAKAGVSSILRVYTHKTADCSRALVLPDLKLQALLPMSGVKEFAIPAMKKGDTLFGTCGMGMYSFEITFTE